MTLPFRLLSVLLLALLPWQGALAHGAIDRAFPKAGSVLKGPPAAVKVRFNEKVEARFSSMEVADASGQRVEGGPVQLAPDARTMEVPLKPLAAGVYTVSWHVVSVDTHTTSGRFTFEVRP